MDNVIKILQENWGLISTLLVGIYTLCIRLFPTKKNWDLLGGVIKLLDTIVPNLKRDDRDGSITHHCIILILFLLPFVSSGQNNGYVKGLYSFNVSDTAKQKTDRLTTQTLYGNAGNIYFDKGRNKWRVWAGTCPTCTVDSAYVDLLNPAGGGFVNPMTTLGDIITGGIGGTPQRLGAGSNGQSLTISGGVPTWQTPTSLFFKNGLTKQADSITVKLGGNVLTPIIITSSVNSTFSLGDGIDDFSSIDFISIGQFSSSWGGGNITGNSNAGLLYGGDYSANYTDRSLTDRGFVNTHLAGTTFTNSPSNGNVPTFNGTNWTFSTPAATSPAGSNTQIQYNNSGSFGGNSNFIFDSVNKLVTVGSGNENINLRYDLTNNPTITSTTTGLFTMATNTGDIGILVSGTNKDLQLSATDEVTITSDNATIGTQISTTQNNGIILSVADNAAQGLIVAREDTGVRKVGLYNWVEVLKAIDSTPSDGVTVDCIACQFVKDTSGATFTFTNSMITANSIIVFSQASAPLTQHPQIVVVAGAGSAVFTWYVSGIATAPDINNTINFYVLN